MEPLMVGVVVVIALVAAGYWASYQVRQQVVVHTPFTADEAERIVVTSFPRLLWKQVGGDGEVNYQRRLYKYPGPVLSADFDPGANGGTDVQIWMSGWTNVYLMAAGAEHAYLQRRRMIKRLTDGHPVRID